MDEAPLPGAALRVLVMAALCGVVLVAAGASLVAVGQGKGETLLSCHTCHM